MSITRTLLAWGSLLAVFVVGCTGSNDVEVGSIKVSVTTTGSNPDPDGFTVVIGQQSGEPIPANGAITVTELLPGDYPVRLSGLTTNCFLVGSNPVTVKVTADAQATASFDVSCPGAGAHLRVTTQATGSDFDPDGYLLKVGATSVRVPAQGILTFAIDEEGALPVELTDVAANCTADPTNPSTVTTTQGAEAALTLKVACTATTGAIKVTVATSGSDLQVQGFLITVGQVSKTLNATRTTTFAGLIPGTQLVSLDVSSLNSNCVAPGFVSRSVVVTVGATTEVTFNVTCAALARVNASVATLGQDLDTDGYTLRLVLDDYYQDISYTVDIASNGATPGPVIPPGVYYLYVSNVAANCRFTNATPSPVRVGATDVTLSITVQCDRAHQLAFVSGAGNASEIWVGSETGVKTLLTNNTVPDSNPAWSPDGARLAFASARDGNSEIYVMNADGSNVVRLTNSASADYQPTWSSDGTRIAFVSQRDGNAEIYVMATDGSNATRLTNNAATDLEPAWSPTGDHILFVSRRSQPTGGVHVMNADGSGVAQLTAQALAEASPAWSPAGGQIAFMRTIDASGAFTLEAMNSDGSGVTNLFMPSTHFPGISWAPNSSVALITETGCSAFGCTGHAVTVHRVDGTSAVLPWSDSSEPAWRP